MWEVSKNTPAILWLQPKEESFFYNRQGRREASIRGQRVTKSSKLRHENLKMIP